MINDLLSKILKHVLNYFLAFLVSILLFFIVLIFSEKSALAQHFKNVKMKLLD